MPTIELTKENFQSTIDTGSIVLVDFWASWCGPCRIFESVFERVSEKNPDIVFGKVNTEEQRELTTQHNIMSIPTLMIFKEKILVFRQSGALPEKALEELVARVRVLDMDRVRAEMQKNSEV